MFFIIHCFIIFKYNKVQNKTKQMNHKRINARIEKWRTMIKEGVHKDEELLKSRIRKGVPQAIRALAWPEIVDMRAFLKSHEGNYTY